MRSSPAVPAKNAVSGDTTGRSTGPAVSSAVTVGPAGDGAAGGRYFSTRNIIDATGSPATYQVLRGGVYARTKAATT